MTEHKSYTPSVSARLDTALVEGGLLRSRALAKEAVEAQLITVNGIVMTKASRTVYPGDIIIYSGESPRFVSRGGLKLEAAVKAFQPALKGAIALDAGASTGGFTDCMLQYGADEVYAVECGESQLVASLLENPKVHSYEKTDVRSMPQEITSQSFDFIAGDLSFISLKQVLPVLLPLLKPEGSGIFLIKPEFEAGKGTLGKRGILKNKAEHFRVLNDILSFLRSFDYPCAGLIPSPIRGGSGNIEYLIYTKKGLADVWPDVRTLVQKAFEELQ